MPNLNFFGANEVQMRCTVWLGKRWKFECILAIYIKHALFKISLYFFRIININNQKEMY